jgi:hypothetical protein
MERMPAIRRLLVVASLIIAFATGEAFAFGSGERVEVPIRQTKLSDGVIRYSVPVSIGGAAPIEAMFDTGSIGLRVLTAAAPESQYTPTGIQRTFVYEGGLRFHGDIATAIVSVGGASTDSPIPIQVVRTFDCAESARNCPAAKVSPEQFGIGGRGFPNEGFPAIVGVSMRSPQAHMGAINPLSHIGNHVWIVVLPRPGDAAPGQLIINPTPTEISGFKPFQMQSQPTRGGGGDEAPGWIDKTVPVCPEPTREGCSATRIDSGSAAFLKPFWSYAFLYDQNKGVVGVKVRP